MGDASLYISNMPEAVNAYALSWSTGTHGADTLHAKIRMSVGRAYELYRNFKNRVVTVFADNRFLFRGRLEDIAIIDQGIEVTAFGLWRVLSDVPYTALWSDTDTRKWNPTNEGLIAVRSPEKYMFANDNRVRIGLKKNVVYGYGTEYAGMYYRAPDKGVRSIVQLQFDYAIKLPTQGVVDANAYDASYSWLGIIWPVVVGTGSLVTGSVSVTVPSASILEFVVGNGSGATYTNTAEDDRYYVQFTNLRVMSVSGSTVTPGPIIQDVLAKSLLEYSEAPLSSYTALISDSAVDLPDEVYEDMSPSDIIDKFSSIGDSAGNPYEAGVDNSGLVYFRPKYSVARTWYVDTANMALTRSIEGLVNSAYGVYKESGGFTRRTATATDAPSQIAYGITRRQPLTVDTSSVLAANQYRDVFVGDNKQPETRAGLEIFRVYSPSGVAVPLYSVQAGDTLIVRNVQAASDPGRNNIDTFRISRTEYDAAADTLKVEPERPLPSLDALIARNAAGLRNVGAQPSLMGGKRQYINYLYKP